MRQYDYRGMAELALTVPQKDIYYISWNIDACEGLALLETVDAKAGKVIIHTPKNLLNDVLSLIDGLRSEGIAIDINETKEI